MGVIGRLVWGGNCFVEGCGKLVIWFWLIMVSFRIIGRWTYEFVEVRGRLKRELVGRVDDWLVIFLLNR